MKLGIMFKNSDFRFFLASLVVPAWALSASSKHPEGPAILVGLYLLAVSLPAGALIMGGLYLLVRNNLIEKIFATEIISQIAGTIIPILFLILAFYQWFVLHEKLNINGKIRYIWMRTCFVISTLPLLFQLFPIAHYLRWP